MPENQNDDLKAKMREALERKQQGAEGVADGGHHKEKGSAGSDVITRQGLAATSTISFTGKATKVGRGDFETSLSGWAVVPLGTCVVAGASDYA